MTNEVNYTPIKYACNGATDSFSFQWKIIAASDLIVILEDETTKEQITLIDGVDYMLYQDIVGGYIVTTNKYPQGKNIILSREVSQYQDKTYSSSSGFQAKEIEESFDKLSANVQDLKYTLDRALKVPVGSSKLNVEFPENLINDNTLVWSDEQDAFVNYDVIGEMDSFEQEIGADVDAFKSSVNQTLQQNKENTDADILSFKQSVNSEVSSFKQNVNTQIETFEQEIEADVDSFKNTTNQTLQQNKQNTDADIASFKQNVNSEISTFKEEQQTAYDEFAAGVDAKIEKVADAAEKIDELEESVVVAVEAAEQATKAAEELTGALDSFVTKEELDEAVENVDVDLTGYIKNKEAISGAISIGNTTSTVQSTTIGSGASSAKNGTALGYTAKATGENSVAVGKGTEANGVGATAIGNGSLAVASGTALGSSSKASGANGSVAVGGAQATGEKSIAIGSAIASAQNAIQIGQGTNSTADTLQVGNYPLLNLSTGKIPEDRLPEQSGGREVGEFVTGFWSAGFVPDNLLYCDGTEFSGAEGQMFRNLWTDYILTGKLDTCSYSEYENDLLIYGQCPRWAVDTANEKFRIPFIKDGTVIQQAGADSIGKSYNAGLPNITGNTPTLFGGIIDSYPTTGSFRATRAANRNYSTTSGSENGWVDVNFDASLSNPIYGNSDTVQMNAVAVRHFVVVATGSINQSEMDWSAWASGLQGKANTDLSNTNPNASFRRDSVRWGIPDYEKMVEIDVVSNGTTTYAAVQDGIFWGKQISSTAAKTVKINGHEVFSHFTNSGTISNGFFFPVYQGDIITVENTTTNNNQYLYFAPYRE